MLLGRLWGSGQVPAGGQAQGQEDQHGQPPPRERDGAQQVHCRQKTELVIVAVEFSGITYSTPRIPPRKPLSALDTGKGSCSGRRRSHQRTSPGRMMPTASSMWPLTDASLAHAINPLANVQRADGSAKCRSPAPSYGKLLRSAGASFFASSF